MRPEQAVDWLKALAEPHRFRLVQRLLIRSHNASELLDGSGLSQPGLSRHLRILREAGVTSETPRGRNVFYALAEPARVQGILDTLRSGAAKHIIKSEYELPKEDIQSGSDSDEFQEWLR